MSTDDDSPLACKLDEARKEARRPEAEALFVDALLERTEYDSGWEFRFPADDEVLERIFQFVDAERKCCPFFQFEIHVDPDDGPVRLRIGGDDRVHSFVTENLVAEVDRLRAD